MVNWIDIHEDFGKEIYYGKTYQQLWEEWGLTYQDAQSWIKTGLDIDDYEFAAYLRHKNHQPNQTLNLNQLRKEFNTWIKKNKPAKEYLDVIYPQNQRNTIKKLNIREKNLTGNLDLNDFVNLEELDCRYNQLTDLVLPTTAEQLTNYMPTIIIFLIYPYLVIWLI